jgi:hypothetical protein
MMNTEYFDEPISVTASLNDQGQTTLQKLTWRDQQYTIVGVGRQWDQEEGRHIMAEAADGTRFEIQLRRQDLIWYIRKVWRQQLAA